MSVFGTKEHPWEKSYPPNVNWELNAVNKPVHSIFEDSSEKSPNAPCIDFLGNKYTYGDIQTMINQVAYGLQNMGVKKGDRVGICLPNTPYFVAIYFGALKIGATVVNFNPLYTEDEIRHQVKDSGVSVMFTLDLKLLLGKVQSAINDTNLETIVVCSLPAVLPTIKSFLFKTLKFSQRAAIPIDEYHIRFEALTNNNGNVNKVEIDPLKDIALLQYTGGTTGLPKGAMLTHSNVVSNAHQAHLWLGGSENDKFMAVLPFFHVFAMTAIMNLGLLTGSELILLPRFELKLLLKTLHRSNATIFSAVPTIYAAINNYPKLHKYNLSHIRYCISGGAGLPSQVKKDFTEHTGCVLVEGYGLSEASPVVCCNPPHDQGKDGAIGLPLPGTEIEIRDLKNLNKAIGIGKTGEIFVRGPQVMQGYWHRDIDTKDSIRSGWLRTGDVGHVDDDGYVFLTDRMKDIIIVNGYNVYPRVIEDALYEHPDVAEVIAIGIKDAEKGEVPKAFVKLKDGANVWEKDLIMFAKAHLNPIEKPAVIEIRKELPKTLIGKLSKKELYEEERLKNENKET